MRIAYNPKSAEPLKVAPSGDYQNAITFDLAAHNIYARGELFKGTDTTYEVFKKHTTSNNGGSNGLVPVPSYTTTAIRFLREDGTWVVPHNSETHLYIGAKSSNNNNNNNSATSNNNTYIKLFDDTTLRHQYQIKGTGLVTVASDANGNITINTPINHNQPTSDINKLTGYTIATSAAALTTTDTLNAALGKLEYKLNVAYDLVTKANDKDGTIENLKEILDVLSGISDTETIKALVGKYLPLAGGTMTLGEGLKFHADENYFGTNSDARIISLLDGNGTTCDGGLIIDERCTSNGTTTVTELLRIRDSEFKWRGNNILHAGNAYIKDGTITINGTSITPLTAHQSLANYVTLNSAQTISGVKTFSAQQKFTVAQGKAPFSVASTTVVSKLNADLLDGYNASGLFTNLSNSGNNISITIGGTNKTLTPAYASSAGNADTVDNYHASNLVKFYLSPMTSGAPADSAKSWFINTMPSSSGAIVYNVPGSEKTIIVGKSSGAHGHMLQLNYDDNYLRILRYSGGAWKTTDWEKISAGYADSAGYANSAGSVAWANVTGKPTSLPANGGNADTVDGQHFNWNNNKNDHTYIWAASSNGQAYLVHRASMSVNYASSAGSVAWGNITGKPSTFTPSSHTHDDRYYTESEADSRFVNVSGDTMTGNITLGTYGMLGFGSSIAAKYLDSAAPGAEANAVWLVSTGGGGEAAGICADGNTITMWSPMDTAPRFIDSDDGKVYTIIHSGNYTNYFSNTWRGITDSYSGTDSTISLSQKGGNALYNALVNGYASSAGSVPWSGVTGKPSFFSGNYNDLTNKPTIPSVGNGTVTIKQGGSTKGSFTMNQSGNTTIELTDNNTTYSFTNNNPTLSWGTKSTIGTVGGVALTVTMPANPNTNTWRSITNSYSGVDTTISLSQKGANDLYKALSGYKSTTASRNTSNTTAGTLQIRQWGPFVNICGRITLKYTNTNTAYVAFTVPSTIGAPVADVGFHITYYGTGSDDDRGCLLYASAGSRTFYFTYNELNNTPSVYINICYFTETSTFTLTKI